MLVRMLRGLPLLLLLMLCLAALTACGSSGDDDASPDDSSDEDANGDTGNEGEGSSDEDDGDEPADEDNGAQGGSGEDGCQVTVTGGVETSFEVSGVSTFLTSDYWFSEDDKRFDLEFSGYSEAEIEQMLASNEPIYDLLAIGCFSQDGSVHLTASDATTLDDVPFGEGTYPISAAHAVLAEPGEFAVVSFAFADPGIFAVAEGGGELVITRWDTERIEGEFSFAIEETHGQGELRSGELTGSFSFGCQDSEVCE